MLTSVSFLLIKALHYELNGDIWLMQNKIDDAVYFAITQYHAYPDSLIDLYVPQYESEIRESFDFEQLKDDSLDYAEFDDRGDMHCRIFIGTVFDLWPSGKYHTAWAQSNIDVVEYIKDAVYDKALTNIASENGGWIESGEDDPCDIFFCMVIDSD